MKKLAVSVVVLALVGAGGYFGGEYLLDRSANAALESIKASLPAGSTLEHGTLKTNLLRREVTLDGFQVTVSQAGASARLSAGSLRLQGLPWISGSNIELGEIDIADLRIERGDVITARRWEIDRPSVDIIGRLAIGQNGTNQNPDLGFSASRVEGLTINRAGSKKLEAAIDKIDAGAMQHNRLSHVELTGIAASSQDITGPLVKMTVARMTADDLDLGHVLAADGNIDLLAPLLNNYLSGLAISNLSLGPDGGEPIVLDNLVVTGSGLPDGTRTALDLKVDRLTVPMAAMAPQAAEYYRALGYDKQVIGLEVVGRYDPEQKTFALDPLKLSALDAGSISLKLEFGGVSNLSDLKGGQAAAQMVMSALTLNALDLNVQDGSFTKRVIAQGAKRMEVTPEVYIEQLTNSIRPIRAGGGQGGQKLGQLYGAVASFLLNPGELSILAHPESPVPILGLLFSANDPAGAAEKLNISASNRQLPQTPVSP